MLLNVPREDAAEWDRIASALPAVARARSARVLAVLLVARARLGAVAHDRRVGVGVADGATAVSSVAAIGRVLFTDYMFAFEVTSILIIAAMVGAVVLAREERE